MKAPSFGKPCPGRALLLVAAVLACAGGSARAQSAVTMFGLLDAGLVRESGGASGPSTRVSSGVANGSRLGFKGSEALGGGWSALFMLEAGIQLDTGAASQGGILFGRQSYVGLASPFGSVTLGRQYTPHFDTLALADPFSSGQVGDAKNLMPATGDASTRMTKAIKYASGVHGGVSAELACAPGEAAGSDRTGRQYGGALGYTAGSLNLRLGYHYRNTDTPSSRRGGARNALLAATYSLGAVKAHAGYGVDKGTGSDAPRNAGNPYALPAPPAGSLDSTDLLLGVTVSGGRHTLMASYVRKDDRTALDQDARQLAIGHRYALGRRTDTYLALSRIRNRKGAGYTAGNASEAGTGSRAISAGIRHQF